MIVFVSISQLGLMIPTVFKEATTIATNKKIAENTLKFVKNHGEKTVATKLYRDDTFFV